MSNIKQSIGATLGVPLSVDGLVNVLYVGASNSSWTRAMETQYPGRVFYTLQAAITAAPRGDGTNTFGYNNTRIIFAGQNTATFPITIPTTRSGITIEGLPGNSISTSTDLGAGVALIKVEGNNCTLRNLRLFTTAATQNGDAIQIGSATGAALYTNLDNCIVQGPENGVYTDFANGIVVKDAKYSVLENNTVYGGVGTVVGIKVSAGVGNSTGLTLKNNYVEIVDDTADTAICLQVDASQNFGKIIGGQYLTNSTADAIEINGDDWFLGGAGLAANEDTVGAGAQVDWNGARPKVGQFYVKDINGATAASLFDQANV